VDKKKNLIYLKNYILNIYFDFNFNFKFFVGYRVSFKSINATQLHQFNSHAIYLFILRQKIPQRDELHVS